MSVVLFEGVAGTGKTTRLLEECRYHLSEHPLGPDQYGLALTKFHGSRRRMEAKLKGPEGVGRCVDCVTIDSFAWNLVRRWRGLVRYLGIEVREGDFQSFTSAAGQLLRRPEIGAWVTRRYPLILVDELQDCKGGEVEVLAHLGRQAKCLCAADAFQDLSGAPDNDAITWAKAEGEVVSLNHVARTAVTGLLDAATALRNGETLRWDRSCGFEVVRVPKPALGAAKASWCIKAWSIFGQVAIISPCRPGTSNFVDGLLKWIETNRAINQKNSATAGPFAMNWEAGEDDLCQDLTNVLGLPKIRHEHVECLRLAEKAQRARAYDVRDWLDRQRNVAGRQTVSIGEVIDQIGQIVRWRRAFGRIGDQRRIVLTVHQAKNREFESVIALWPLRIKQEQEQQRRLLYNAITRAKRQALVIVEDPIGNRLYNPPFTRAG
jgi:UvrD-like helicase C-terminal domain/AAA domain